MNPARAFDEPGKVVGTDAVRDTIELISIEQRDLRNETGNHVIARGSAQACAAKQAALISCYCSIVISNKTVVAEYGALSQLYCLQNHRNHSDRAREGYGNKWGSIEAVILFVPFRFSARVALITKLQRVKKNRIFPKLLNYSESRIVL